ncbi:MAG: DOMON domain-containing protein [Candidatus Bipolaricaulota bacterium]
MRRWGFGRRAALTFAVLAAAAVAANAATLSLRFGEGEDFVGHAFGVRVVDAATFAELARFDVPKVESAPFELDLGSLETGRSYRIDLYADDSGNGRYDPPPVDRAWRMVVGPVLVDGSIEVPVDGPQIDIDWPPRVDGRIEAGEYRHTWTDSETGITLSWQNDAEVLSLGLSAATTGWMAVGLDPSARMQGADFLLAAIVGGQVLVEDHYGVGQTVHRKDATSHVIQAAGVEANGVSVVEFSLRLASGDPSDAHLEPGQHVTVLLALHATQDDFVSRHTRRSTGSIVLDGGR